ncbi:MAG: cation diffusion facilitator family transporter [Myxococcota bacterium]|nr:cation diffusion facilitator family transporter [Myxococcota bacterium]
MIHSHDHGQIAKGAKSARAANQRRLTWAALLAGSYMLAELIGGWWTGSLALLADAGHMASDVAALVLAIMAGRIASRPPEQRFSYGFARAEILAALAQGAGLLVVATLIVVEAVERIQAPPEVQALGALLIASGGLAVNALSLFILRDGHQHSLNVRGAWLHVLSDTLGSIGAITSGALILAFGWYWADPAASLFIAALVVASAWHLIRDAVDVLMEAAPRHLDLAKIESALLDLDHTEAAHDLHVWTIGGGEVCLSCHLVATPGSDPTALLEAANRMLSARFDIDHATLQIEPRHFAEADGPCTGACESGYATRAAG